MAEPMRPVVASHVSSRGPRFFRTEEGVMFEITLDHRSKIGPRAATEADSLQYPAAWKTFADAELAADEGNDADAVAPGAPIIQAEDNPQAKAEAEKLAAERQARMDAKRSRVL